MTPQEKWDRLTRPSCIADYGLLLTRDELAQVPDAHHIVELIDQAKEAQARQAEMEKIMEKLGEGMGKTINSLIFRVLSSAVKP